MKICINRTCKHELEDYQERCPYCGWRQKVFVEKKNNINIPDNVEKWIPFSELKERNIIVTIWLYLSIFMGLGASLLAFFPKVFWGSSFPDNLMIFSIISGIFCVLGILGVGLILNWKRIGFQLLLVLSVISAIFSLMFDTFPVSLIGIPFWYFILQIKENGKSCWEQLQ